MTERSPDNAIASLAAEIVSAYVTKNPLAPADLPKLIIDVHRSLASLGRNSVAEQPEPPRPSVPVKKSVQSDHIVCLEEGKKFKSLKRHLMTHHGMTPDEYREKWGLPREYPMVAPDYAAARSTLAKTMGLGRKPKAPEPAPVSNRRGRRKSSE